MLKISTPDNNLVQINLKVDALNPERIEANAKRITKNPPVYEIWMSYGLSNYLWTASRSFAIPDYDILPWTEECKVNNLQLENVGKKEILADYAFFWACYYILLHEISHVIRVYLNFAIKYQYLSAKAPIGKLPERPWKSIKIMSSQKWNVLSQVKPLTGLI